MTLTVLIGNGSWYPVGVAPTITSPSSLPVGTANSAYPSTTFVATGSSPITWSITSGTLPAGMSFSSAGVLSGTPTATASGSITFTATNAFGSANRPLTLTINAANTPVTITRLTLPNGTVSSAYNETISFTGSTPVTWTVHDGVLPTGLSLDSSTGVISGTPSTGSSTQFIIKAINAFGGPSYAAYALRVSPFVVAPYLIENAIPDCHTTVPYSQTFSATGDAPFTWSLSGTLPTGLSFNTSTATLSGTPTSTGSFSFSVSVSNSSGTSTKTITLNSVAFSANRIYGKDLTWIGAIRLPNTTPEFFAYNGGVPAVSVVPSQSVFYMGVGRGSTPSRPGFPVIKADLPAVVNSTNKNDLNTATLIGSYFDTSEGGYTNWTPEANIYGVFWNNNKLYVSAAYNYLNTNTNPAIYSRSDALVNNGSVSGFAKINNTSRFYVGGFDATPPSVVSAGLPALSVGGSSGSINTMYSNGPSLFVFNDSSLTAGTTNLTGTELLGYPHGSALCTLYGWNGNQQNPYYQVGVTSYRGYAWIQSKPVLLVFGTHCLGQSWYGTLTPGGARTVEPFDLCTISGVLGGTNDKGNQGVENYPYVWAYDQQDLIDVYNGTKQANSIKPYDVWKLPFPSAYFQSHLTANASTGGVIGEVSHDPANKRIYVMLKDSESFNRDFITWYIPMLHVFSYP